MRKLRKLVATSGMAAIFFWTPSAVPTSFGPPGVQLATPFLGCGTFRIGGIPSDTAYAIPPVLPCPVQPKTPIWPIVTALLSVTSVITNGFIIGQTQCRELTMQEAWTSIFLPFIGIMFDQQNNQCGKKPNHHHH